MRCWREKQRNSAFWHGRNSESIKRMLWGKCDFSNGEKIKRCLLVCHSCGKMEDNRKKCVQQNVVDSSEEFFHADITIIMQRFLPFLIPFSFAPELSFFFLPPSFAPRLILSPSFACPRVDPGFCPRVRQFGPANPRGMIKRTRYI